MRPNSSDSVQTSCSSGSGSSQFQMMHISISILVLEGLIMECNISKEQLKASFSGSIDSGPPLAAVGDRPVTAVISCFKNISGNRAIATHVPSLPLGAPKESLGKKNHQFTVRWPVDYDPSGDALSTFRCKRLMKKEYPTQYPDDRFDTFAYGYDAEEIELNICLRRGSEMITLGAANLVVTGEEMEEIIVDLPIDVTKGATKRDRRSRSASPLRRTGSKLFGSGKPSNRVMKAKPFPADTRRKYKLREQSMVRVRVMVNPNNRPSSSFDEFGPEPNENIYQSLSYQHPNVQQTRPIAKPVPSPRPDIRHSRTRSMSNPRLIVSQPSFQRNQNSRSSSVVNGRDSGYNEEPDHQNMPQERNIATHHRYVASDNSRQEMRSGHIIGNNYSPRIERKENGYVPQNHSVGEKHSVRRERKENGHPSQEYKRQDFHARSRSIPAEHKFAVASPDKRKNFHKRMVLRNEQGSQKVDRKGSQTIFETILSHGASFMNGPAPAPAEKENNGKQYVGPNPPKIHILTKGPIPITRALLLEVNMKVKPMVVIHLMNIPVV
eukprot:CAMPEP_0198273298 /NCGR_PEP_ID=MMETSP1447-20131203/56466_1 /TAXON_ID=420782 /ORGANISM="Chaetoceros dichaeta, Strain CCMP1751" /LENGTH=550 /DNA_ID=CAMNT_0043966945 /DNA_START=175 /DNA_END=1828 /DNA_ORIENTATION=+